MLVTNGRQLLIGHATRSPRWDVPKGLAEPDEAPEDAARRELLEETGLQAPPDLAAFGILRYMPAKDLALFAWLVAEMPDPAGLICRSTFMAGGAPRPEFDRFDIPVWAAALPRLGKAMQATLAPIAAQHGWLAP